MTSHTLAQFDATKSLSRDQARSNSMQESCSFCRIVSTSLPAHILYQDDDCIAFLDILPLRRGHTLVIPKQHVATISALQPHHAATLAKALLTVTRAVGKALKDDRLQVIANQIYAQVVPHVHFHIVPAPPLSSSSSPSSRSTKPEKDATSKSSNPMSLLGLGHGRQDLDDDEAEQLVTLIKREINVTPAKL